MPHDTPSHRAPSHAPLRELEKDLRSLRDEVVLAGHAVEGLPISMMHAASATNLAQYMALRRHDLRPLQHRLAALGLSSLGRSETHVQASLDAVLEVLRVLTGDHENLAFEGPPPKLDDGTRLIEAHTARLLGRPTQGRHVRVMVTLPSEAADDPSLIMKLVACGMNVARINCAHDDPSTWHQMASRVRRAARVEGKDVKIAMDLGGPKIRTGKLAAGVDAVRLQVGDLLRVARVATPEPSERDDAGPRIGCLLPEALLCARVGDPVYFDDGKYGGLIRKVDDQEVAVEITHARAKGAKVKPDQGINLPAAHIDLPALTDKDLEDLSTVVELADAVALSFTQSPDDIRRLHHALTELGRPSMGVIAKVETRAGFENLPGILLALMEGAGAGVMIARGDLAVELGYVRLAEVQEEMLWLCEAAHMPVIWATQVLESLAKKGIPSRAEITDAAMGERAECVMLNKGPYVLEAVRMLDDILCRMQRHQRKKTPLLRALTAFG